MQIVHLYGFSEKTTPVSAFPELFSVRSVVLLFSW
uniref:Uncharacterized protein n=1 Tax=Arundo donax TaxID=35708 RepID=A0A0A8Z166_ARUDO